jgi:hypothetical protein
MKPLITLIKNTEPAALDANAYGYDKIHFLHFNYDGKGSALVTHDDDLAIDSYIAVDVENILFGTQDGVKIYLREPAVW